MSLWRALLRTNETEWVILVRLPVGLVVFFPEGLQKLLFPEVSGAERWSPDAFLAGSRPTRPDRGRP
ncbi:hypothetical protein [Methylobacterium sp. CM6257]|jgi:hypothetical protein